jgi:hypothetical protein
MFKDKADRSVEPSANISQRSMFYQLFVCCIEDQWQYYLPKKTEHRPCLLCPCSDPPHLKLPEKYL